MHRKLDRLLTYWAIFLTNLVVITGGVALLFLTLPPLKDIGTSLVASGIVGWFSLYVVKVQQAQRESVSRLIDSGLVDIYPDRSEKTIYAKYLTACEKHLDIQAESLSRFYTDFKDILPKLDSKGVKIRLLLLDPDSVQCEMRQKEEAEAERMDLAKRIRQQTHQFLALQLKNLELRWYACTPGINYFRADDFTFFGSYFVGIISRNSLTFLAKTYGKVVIPYTQHFEKVWNEFSRKAE